MTLNDVLSLVHRVSVRIRVEVPDRHGVTLRDGLYARLVVTLVVPLGIFLVNSKWTFHDTCAKKSTLKGCCAKLLRSTRLFQLIVDFLLHLLCSNSSRMESNLSLGTTFTFFETIGDRLKGILETTDTFVQIDDSFTRLQFSVLRGYLRSATFCLLHFRVRLEMYCFCNTLWQSRRVDRNGETVVAEEDFNKLTVSCENLGLGDLHEDT